MSLLAEKQETSQDVALITVISSDRCRSGAMMVVDGNGDILGGSIGASSLDEKAAEAAKTCLSRGLSRRISVTTEDGNADIFLNALCNHDRLLIAGAGNVAQHVYKYACILGYKVVIFDNRAEMLTRDRFPEAVELILGDIAENIASYDISENTSIVIASHHHEFDEEILQKVLNSPAGYIGMLSNRRKIVEIFERLRSLGFAEEIIARVHAPIGLDLGGKKTAEIALAIMAEVQAVKYGRNFNSTIPQNTTK